MNSWLLLPVGGSVVDCCWWSIDHEIVIEYELFIEIFRFGEVGGSKWIEKKKMIKIRIQLKN